jgi:hypothetical protein
MDRPNAAALSRKRSYGKVILTEAERLELRNVGWLCKACGADLTKSAWHLDHIIPRARQGSDAPANFQVLCANCNIDKSDQIHQEWAPELVDAGILAALPPTKYQYSGGRRRIYVPLPRGVQPIFAPVEERTSPLSRAARRRVKKRRRR